MSPFFILLLLLTTVLSHPLNTTTRAEAGGPSFSYLPDSGMGPSDWGSIESFETCGTGEAQSPIDLPTVGSIHWRSEGPETHLKRTTLKFEHTTENFELNCEHAGECGFSMIEGQRFDIVNMHFHSPSEHKLGGEQFPLEAHMVHRSETGQLAVISTLFRSARYLAKFKRGDTAGEHREIERTWRQCERGRDEIRVNLNSYLGQKGYVYYPGSLTTPPCTEGVKWYIGQTIPIISVDEIQRYIALAQSHAEVGNNRPTQPMHDRTLEAFVRN